MPLRPSAEDRERVVRVLRDRSVEGRLSTETFAESIRGQVTAESATEYFENKRRGA